MNCHFYIVEGEYYPKGVDHSLPGSRSLTTNLFKPFDDWQSVIRYIRSMRDVFGARFVWITIRECEIVRNTYIRGGEEDRYASFGPQGDCYDE